MRHRRAYRRSKREFKSARSAWRDIARTAGIGIQRVTGRAHTRTHWVFLVRKRR